MKRIAALILTLAALTACHHSVEMDPGFVEESGMSLISGKKTLLRYDPLTWQLSYIPAKREFRVFSDDMSSYYILSCKTLPREEGEAITATLEWTGSDGLQKKSGAKFTVKKIADDGRIWLWSSSEGLGVVVRMLYP